MNNVNTAKYDIREAAVHQAASSEQGFVKCNCSGTKKCTTDANVLNQTAAQFSLSQQLKLHQTDLIAICHWHKNNYLAVFCIVEFLSVVYVWNVLYISVCLLWLLFNPNTVEMCHTNIQGLHEIPEYNSDFMKSLKWSGISRNPWFHTLTVTYIPKSYKTKL